MVKEDARHLRKTNRIIHFATKVTPELDKKIRDWAKQKKMLMVEVTEEAFETYFNINTINNKGTHTHTHRERERERRKLKSSAPK